MVNSAIELHDSVISSISQEATTVLINFSSVYIHKSEGRPGIDVGTGWTQKAILKIKNAEIKEIPDEFPCYLSGGEIYTGDKVIDNLIPLPFECSEEVRLELKCECGSEIILNGKGLQFSLLGEPLFIEDVPAEALIEVDFKLAEAGNTYNAALSVIKSKGYRIWRGLDAKRESFQDWFAQKGHRQFIASCPLSLLGLIIIWEQRGDDWQSRDDEPDFYDLITTESSNKYKDRN